MAQDPDLENPMERFKEAQAEHNYRGQAAFFLNAFWVELGEAEAQNFWDYAEKMGELDKESYEEGHSLDFAKSLSAKLFLEHFGQALSHVQLKEALTEIDADNDKRMSLLEYAVWKYGERDPTKFTIEELMRRPQGVNKALKDAQARLDEVQAEIDKIEKKRKKLEADIVKFEGKVVKLNRAKNELEQLLAADPTELNRAIISAQAAVRIAQRAENLNAQGTLWFLNKELEIKASYKPKGNLKK